MISNNRMAYIMVSMSVVSSVCAYKEDNQYRMVLAELKGAYVLPAADTFRDIYHNSGEFSGELTAQLKAQSPFFGFASVGVIPLKGKSVGFCTKTNATLVPLAAGLKYFCDVKRGDIYVGLGVLGAHLKTKDHSSYVISPRSKWGVGGVAKIGFIYDLPKSWFIDIFSDYGFVKVKFPNTFTCGVESHKANVSHWTLGLGIGYTFA